VFWVISVYFNIRNTLPKSGTFLLGHPVYFNLQVCGCAVTMEDGVSTFFSCRQTEVSSSCPNTKIQLTAFPATAEESAVSVNYVAEKNRKRLVVGGECPELPLQYSPFSLWSISGVVSSLCSCMVSCVRLLTRANSSS